MTDTTSPIRPCDRRYVPLWRGALAVGLFAAALYLPGLGRKHIWSSDEGQRAYPPIEMLETGDWVIPRINGDPYLKKPPFLYWQVVPVYAALGVSEWTARLPSALAGIALVVLVFLWARRFSAPRTAAWAALFTATGYMVVNKSRQCQLDIHLTLFIVATQWAWWEAMRRIDAGRPARRPLAWAALWLAIAHFYKFPIPYLFILPGWIGAALVLRHPRWLVRPMWWLVLIVSVVPVGLWAWAAVSELGLDYVRRIWEREAHLHVVKATEINSGPIWYYVVHTLANTAPWCLLLPVLFMRRFRRAQSERPLIFAYIWTTAAGSLALLTTFPAKESEYMLPAIPSLAILLAWAWEWVVERAPWSGPAWAFVRRRFVAIGLVGWLIIVWGVFWALESYHNGRRSVKEPIETARRAAEEGRPIAVMSDAASPYVFFYLRGRAPTLYGPEDFYEFFEGHGDGLLIANHKEWRQFRERYADAPLELAVEPNVRASRVLVRYKAGARDTPFTGR